MKLSTIKNITKSKSKVYDITVENNHNFFCNNHLIHNCDYRGEIMAVLINLSNTNVTITKGDKIAQIIFTYFASVSFTEVSSLKDTQRNTGGFGSTDIKKTIQNSDLGISLEDVNKDLVDNKELPIHE